MLMEAKEERERQLEEQRVADERAAAEAAGTALAVQEPAPLDVDRRGFQAFALEGGELELLISETVDGRLALADCYLGAVGPGGGVEPGGYSRPAVAAEVPAEPGHWHPLPWVERGSGDTFKRKEPVNKVKKIYFLGLAPGDPEEEAAGEMVPDLDSVFVFDAKERSFEAAPVRVVGKQPLVEPVLRLRPSGLTLEESMLLPDPVEVSMTQGPSGSLADLSPEELAERLAELERQAEELDELDEAPDIPSVDAM